MKKREALGKNPTFQPSNLGQLGTFQALFLMELNINIIIMELCFNLFFSFRCVLCGMTLVT